MYLMQLVIVHNVFLYEFRNCASFLFQLRRLDLGGFFVLFCFVGFLLNIFGLVGFQFGILDTISQYVIHVFL